MIAEALGLILVGTSLVVFIWAFYHIPIIIAGFNNLQRSRKKTSTKTNPKTTPSFLIVAPVKNEEKVIARLLSSLSNLNYPTHKKEILIVEDGSTDRTLELCLNYAKEHPETKILHRSSSNGKSSALNYAVRQSKADLVAIFDADNIPDRNVLNAVVKYFDDPTVAAVQGKTLSVNPRQNMLTRFISYEEAVWCEVYLRGKDVLNLFVHLKGSCQFIRRNIVEKLKGFNEKVLSEDVEISARITKNNYRIRYASDVVAWQESPSTLKALFRQRTRWFRGITELSFKYGTLLGKPNWKNLDAEATLFAPFMLVASLLPYLATFSTFFSTFPINIAWSYILQFAALTTSITLLVFGLALAYATRPIKMKNVLWLPFIYFYWSLQAFIAFYAMLLIALRRPRKWMKTEKTGVVSSESMDMFAVLPDAQVQNLVVSLPEEGETLNDNNYE